MYSNYQQVGILFYHHVKVAIAMKKLSNQSTMNQHKLLALDTLMVMKVIYVMQRFAKANEK